MSLRSLITTRPWVVSMISVFCGSAPAGNPWAATGATGETAKLTSKKQTAIKRDIATPLRFALLVSYVHLKSDLEPVRHNGGHKGRHVASHAGNLPHQSGADGTHRWRRRQEHGQHVGRHRGVHPGELHLVVEVGAIAQAADHESGADPASSRNRKIVEGDAGELATRRANHDAAGLLQHCDALIGRKQRRLAGMHP